MDLWISAKAPRSKTIRWYIPSGSKTRAFPTQSKESGHDDARLNPPIPEVWDTVKRKSYHSTFKNS